MPDVTTIEQRLRSGATLSEHIDRLYGVMRDYGFDTLIYDYTPTRYGLDGRMMLPAVLELRNIDETMRDYWSGHGYARLDPVQRVAVRTTAPFFWNYDPKAETLIRAFLTEESAPVAHFLAERGLTAGVTAPVHLPGGDYATVTGTRSGEAARCEREARLCLAEVGLAAHIFQREAAGALSQVRRAAGLVRLTARERQCLRHSAEGLSAKEISRLIDRAVPTVVMHLNAATRKLGARNRMHAAVLAARLHLLDEPLD